MSLNRNIPSQSVLDGLGQGVLIFDGANNLIMENHAARTLLGNDLTIIRNEGWAAATMLFNAGMPGTEETLDSIRLSAFASEAPIRFHIFRSGESIPCWAAAVHGQHGEIYTMLTMDSHDWTVLSELFENYIKEVRESIEAAQGHATLISQVVQRPRPNETVEQLGRRISGFTRVINTHMHRLGTLTEQMERFERIRTHQLHDEILTKIRRLNLTDFIEDFIETVDELVIIDPEAESESSFRPRISLDISDELMIRASPAHLSLILRDILRNAIMYSMKATPIRIMARVGRKDQMVKIDVMDEGYGIRTSEMDRVFVPFMRTRQPQIMAEFGYGLSLYLCKQEIEAMSGRLWFESEEGMGTVFSLKLPIWLDNDSESSSLNLDR